LNKFKSALAIAAFASVAFANAQTVVYAPERSVADQHISLRGWGSGTIAQTDEMAYEGTNSIRVSSRNFFQGGIMTFGAPVNLSQQFGDKNNMLRITLQAPDLKTTISGGGGGGGGQANNPGNVGAAGAGVGNAGAPGSGNKGGGGGLGQGLSPGGAGGQGRTNGGSSGGSAPVAQPPLSVVRMIVTTSDGLKSEAYVPISTSGKGERGWKQVSIPLEAITGFGRTNKMIKELAFAGDSVSTFYVGDIRVVNDTTPINGEAKIDRTNMALGDEATLTAYGYGGSSVLKYEWDFDSDGKVDTEGTYVKHKFRKAGDFVITLTVSDVYGLKAPYKTQLKVHVNP
jgi:hypothetical protein